MRLWHQDLIPKLPRPQLLGQHRECCALRGNGWGKRSTRRSTMSLTTRPIASMPITRLIMEEMTSSWLQGQPRVVGVDLPREDLPSLPRAGRGSFEHPIYPEHQDTYLQECLDNPSRKGIPN